MKNKKVMAAMVVLGVILLAAGVCLILKSADTQGIMPALPYVCIGVGCGLGGHGLGELLFEQSHRRDAKSAKKVLIEQNDERNIAIANRAKGRAFDAMTIVYGALMLVLALLGTEITAVLLLVAAYLLVHGFSLYYRFKLAREM